MADLHPRPQLAREHWIDLCGPWRFAYDDDGLGRSSRWQDLDEPFDRTIEVPFPPESKQSGVGDTGYHPVVWYRRTFDAGALTAGERLVLHFGAVDYTAEVWVDGRRVAEHTGGHVSFSVDVTDALGEGTSHELVVRAEDRADDPAQPRGKQDWSRAPHGIWYHRTTGIWQPVWAERVPALHIAELAWTPDLENAGVRVDVRLSEPVPAAVSLRLVLRLKDEVLADQNILLSRRHDTFDVAIPALRHGQDLDRLLWTPESPTLVDAELTLAGEDSTDDVRSYLGLRSASFQGGRFLLNGRPYYLRMVLEQGFWPQSHLAAPDGQALRREVELIKELGFNGARVHQKIEDPRFLSWCDRLGLLVWGEMAAAYEFSAVAVQRTVTEWLEAVRRDHSHPCIVTWVPLNESWGIPQVASSVQQQDYANALYHLTRAVDPSRPVISNDGWEHLRSDIWGVHDYAPQGESLRERYGSPEALQRTLRGAGPGRRRVLLGDADDRGQPVVVSEFGGLSYEPRPGQDWFGYGLVETADELEERLRELVDALLDCEDVAGFCYTQLTDTLQERNGLLTEDREPKLPPSVVHGILTRPSRAIPSELVDARRREARRAIG